MKCPWCDCMIDTGKGSKDPYECFNCGWQQSGLSPKPWKPAFSNRGHGHGDYAIMDANHKVVAKLQSLFQAREAYLLAIAPEMIELLEFINEKYDLDEPEQKLMATLILKSGNAGAEAAEKAWGAG